LNTTGYQFSPAANCIGARETQFLARSIRSAGALVYLCGDGSFEKLALAQAGEPRGCAARQGDGTGPARGDRRAGRPTSEFTEAHDQLNDWRSWFARDGNKALFRERFLFFGEKYEDRPLEPQYVLIYGRASEFGVGGGHANPRGCATNVTSNAG
jgi:hypothetical protein